MAGSDLLGEYGHRVLLLGGAEHDDFSVLESPARAHSSDDRFDADVVRFETGQVDGGAHLDRLTARDRAYRGGTGLDDAHAIPYLVYTSVPESLLPGRLEASVAERGESGVRRL